MGILKLFGQKGFDPDVFEKELTTLTGNIARTQQQIRRVQETEKRLYRGILKHMSIIYLAMVAFMYHRASKIEHGSGRVMNFIWGQDLMGWMILIGWPFLEMALLYVLGYISKIIIRRRESSLEKMKTKHSQKLEDLKRITNYNTTNDLLSRYGSHRCEDIREEELSNSGAESEGEAPLTRARSLPKDLSELGPHKIQQLAMSVGPKQPRGILDRLLDLIIGSDESELAENRYALICKQCLVHNGLAPPGCKDPFKVSYICPRCGFLNGEFDGSDETNPIESISIRTLLLSPLSRSPSAVEDEAYCRRPSIVESLEDHSMPTVKDSKSVKSTKTVKSA